MILYTSGTTGRRRVDDLADVPRRFADHGRASGAAQGATVVLEAGFSAAMALELIQHHRATSISGVPTTYQIICEHPACAATDISSLRILTCGGSAVPTRVLDAYEARGLSFTGGYGMTEPSPGASSLQPRYSRAKAGSAGLPHFFTDVRIADDSGTELPAGEVGEIQVRGPNVIAGYWQRPDASAAAFADGGWFRSGDLGYVDETGFLYISDRLKDMIISGGENVYPGEIEQIILEIEAVQAAAVVAVPDERWGEVPHAVLELRPGYTLDDGAIQRNLGERLANTRSPRASRSSPAQNPVTSCDLDVLV